MIGGMFYYFFCPDVYFVKMIDSVTNLSIHFRTDENLIIMLVRNYLLDLIWAYSLSGVLFLFENGRKPYLYSLGLGIIMELLQYFKIIAGTADYFDIIAELLGIILAKYFLKLEDKQNEKEN